jgi:hypothetical protein
VREDDYCTEKFDLGGDGKIFMQYTDVPFKQTGPFGERTFMSKSLVITRINPYTRKPYHFYVGRKYITAARHCLNIITRFDGDE